ncbi:unnamed protein product [Orchesella dallaii]|uniref:Uncharacterized protein n=1 Tax=Orchesella dallaii TaxID=48710 RepID=A0ABP1QGM7_9HEXA
MALSYRYYYYFQLLRILAISFKKISGSGRLVEMRCTTPLPEEETSTTYYCTDYYDDVTLSTFTDANCTETAFPYMNCGMQGCAFCDIVS